MRKLGVALLSALAVLAAGCAASDGPKDLSPMVEAERPKPANATENPEIEKQDGGSEDCNATASLRPRGLSATGTMAEIRKRGKLRVGVDQNTFLFGFRNPATGQLEGFDIDIAKAVAEQLLGDPGKIQFKAITSSQRIPALQEDSVDIVVRTMTITCKRREDIEFSSVYFIAGQRVLVKKNAKIGGLDDLGGKKVCATSGSTSLSNIAEHESHPVPVSVDNWTDCLVMLQQGQVDAISTDDTILAGMAQQDPTLEVVGMPLSDEPYGIGIPKENEDMVRYVNAVLEKVRAGSWQASYDKWIKPVLGAGKPPKPTYK